MKALRCNRQGSNSAEKKKINHIALEHAFCAMCGVAKKKPTALPGDADRRRTPARRMRDVERCSEGIDARLGRMEAAVAGIDARLGRMEAAVAGSAASGRLARRAALVAGGAAAGWITDMLHGAMQHWAMATGNINWGG